MLLSDRPAQRARRPLRASRWSSQPGSTTWPCSARKNASGPFPPPASSTRNGALLREVFREIGLDQLVFEPAPRLLLLIEPLRHAFVKHVGCVVIMCAPLVSARLDRRRSVMLMPADRRQPDPPIPFQIERRRAGQVVTSELPVADLPLDQVEPLVAGVGAEGRDLPVLVGAASGTTRLPPSRPNPHPRPGSARPHRPGCRC